MYEFSYIHFIVADIAYLINALKILVKYNNLIRNIFFRELRANPVLNWPAETSAVKLSPVEMAARVLKYVMSTKEDSNAHVLQDTLDTGAKWRCLLDPVKTSWSLTKWKPMAPTLSWTNRTNHFQSTATLRPSQVQHGLWSSLTLCRTMPLCSRAKPSICTTCQSTKMHPNGTTTACHCPVWSPSGMSPLTGEQLVIFRRMEWTTVITGECPWKTWIFWWHPVKMNSAYRQSLWMFMDITVPTVQCCVGTVRGTLFISTAITVHPKVVTFGGE